MTPNDVKVVYDGTAYTAGRATAVDNVNGKKVTIEYSEDGIQWTTDPSDLIATNVEESITVQIRVLSEYYEGTVKGTEELQINRRPVTISADDKNASYGDDEVKLTATVKNTVEGDVLRYTLERAEGENVGDYEIKVIPEEHPNYEITGVSGTYSVNRRKVILTSASKEAKYNGEAITAPTVYIGGEKFAQGEGADFNVTGRQTGIGSSVNTFTYTLRKGTHADNYEIVKVEGTLTVTEAEVHTLRIRYVGPDGKPVYKAYEKQFAYDSPYHIRTPELAGYTPDKAAVTGKMGPKDIEVTVRYSKNEYDLIIHYVTSDGRALANDDIMKYEYGEHYRIDIPEIDDLIPIITVLEGEMPARNVEVTVLFFNTQDNHDDKTDQAVNSTNVVNQQKGECFE